jgi:hypothetical protein
MKLDGYMLLMLKHLSARGSLFLLVRTHRQLEYYFNFPDSLAAANQSGIWGASQPPRTANVVEIHPVARARSQRRR